MRNVGIEALLIMDKTGIPLLFQKLDPKRADINPVLLSGFLMALKAFSMDVIDKAVGDFQVDYGKRLITLLSGQKIIFAAIHREGRNDEISPVLSILLKEFEEKYYTSLELDGSVLDITKYQPFRERIAEILGLSNPSLEWVPFTIKTPNNNSMLQSSLLEFIDGKNSIAEIIAKSSQSKPAVLQEISRLWTFGILQFRNVLDKKDIVVTTKEISLFLHSSSPEWSELSKQFPEVLHMVPYIVSHLDGKTTVEGILEQFIKEGVENVYRLMDFLFEKGAISILSPENRRILMAKEILQKSLEIATELYSKEETLRSLKEVLKKIRLPELISEIRITEDGWNIDYSFLVYEGLPPEKVLKLYDAWLLILRLFITSLGIKKQKKYLEALTESLDYDFFEKYRGEDMDGFEEFAFWLESIF